MERIEHEDHGIKVRTRKKEVYRDKQVKIK